MFAFYQTDIIMSAILVRCTIWHKWEHIFCYNRVCCAWEQEFDCAFIVHILSSEMYAMRRIWKFENNNAGELNSFLLNYLSMHLIFLTYPKHNDNKNLILQIYFIFI